MLIRHTIALMVTMVLVTGCGGPLWQFPGGALAGEEKDFREIVLPASGGVMALETNPPDPYSVHVGYVLIDGKLYIDPAEARRWYQNITKDPTIRLRLDGSDIVYRATAVAETDPEILASFDADRHVLRMEARPVDAMD